MTFHTLHCFQMPVYRASMTSHSRGCRWLAIGQGGTTNLAGGTWRREQGEDNRADTLNCHINGKFSHTETIEIQAKITKGNSTATCTSFTPMVYKSVPGLFPFTGCYTDGVANRQLGLQNGKKVVSSRVGRPVENVRFQPLLHPPKNHTMGLQEDATEVRIQHFLLDYTTFLPKRQKRPTTGRSGSQQPRHRMPITATQGSWVQIRPRTPSARSLYLQGSLPHSK